LLQPPGPIPDGADAARPQLARWLELCRKHGIDRPAEWASLDEVVAVLKEAYGLGKDEEL